MAKWIIVQKNPETIDLALDILSLGVFGESEKDPNVYRVENMDTGEQKVIKTFDDYELGAIIPSGIVN